eukprot:13927368-Alexandrium_andersonii.AAC.1
MVPVKLEVLVRRLKWMQGVARDPSAHRQRMHALFGRTRGEGWDTVVGDMPSEQANPWYKVLQQAFEQVSDIDDAAWVLEASQGSLYRMLTSPELVEGFAAADVGVLRRRW